MRTIEADIGYSGQMHQLMVEFCRDTRQREPNTDFWLFRFPEPTFRVFFAKHGKKPVGILWGHLKPYYDETFFEVEGFFVRRYFRGKMRFVRGLVQESAEKLREIGVKRIHYSRPKKLRMRSL